MRFLIFRTGISCDSPLSTMLHYNQQQSQHTYLDFHKPFHRLNLCLAEGTTVLGTDISPHCQVGRLICCLEVSKNTKTNFSSYLQSRLQHYRFHFTPGL